MGAMNSILKLSPRVTVTGTGTPAEWTPGPWTEMIASTSTEIQLAGIVKLGGSTASTTLVDIAVGAAGEETIIASVRTLFATNAAYAGNYAFWFPAPIAQIPIGSRVVARIYRVKAAGFASAGWESGTFQLQYYEDADAGISTTQNASCIPYATHGKELTSNAIAWENSDWCEITPGIPREIGMYAITSVAESAAGTRHEEWDIAFGAEGEEVVQTTLRCYRVNFNGERGHLPLPGIYLTDPDTRISVRVRTSEGVARLYREVCLDFYEIAPDVPPVEPPVEPPGVPEAVVPEDCFCDYNPVVIPGTGDGLNPDEPLVELNCAYNPPIVPGTGDGL